jgi:hypothetical protein
MIYRFGISARAAFALHFGVGQSCFTRAKLVIQGLIALLMRFRDWARLRRASDDLPVAGLLFSA